MVSGSTDGLLLVAVSGLPGVGKSELARLIARELSIPIIELDRIEGPLLQRGISGDSIGWAGYEILTALAEDNLEIGQSVVLDSVCWTRAIRERWATLAATYHARYRPIEIVCSNAAQHRRRVESRDRSSRGLHNIDWLRVEHARSLYEAWDRSRLVLDSVETIDGLLREALAYVRR
jgi:predicted kinase